MNRLFIYILFIICLILSPLSIYADKGYISDIVVTNNRDYILLYFKVNNCFTRDIMNAINSGIPTTFTFYIRVFEHRSFLPDRRLAKQEINHTIQYDNIKKAYELKLTERGDKSIWVKDLSEAKRLMSSIIALQVVPLNKIMKGKRYRIKMMAQLDKIRLPFKLHYVFFFLSYWDFKTDWYTVEFKFRENSKKG